MGVRWVAEQRLAVGKRRVPELAFDDLFWGGSGIIGLGNQTTPSRFGRVRPSSWNHL